MPSVDNRGFSLPEVVIAGLITAVSLTASLYWIGISNRRYQQIKIKTAYSQIENDVNAEIASRLHTFLEAVAARSPACITNSLDLTYPNFSASWGMETPAGVTLTLLDSTELGNLAAQLAGGLQAANSQYDAMVARCSTTPSLYPTTSGVMANSFAATTGGVYACFWLRRNAGQANTSGEIASMQPIIIEVRYSMFNVETDTELTCAAIPSVTRLKRIGKMFYKVGWSSRVDNAGYFSTTEGTYAYGG